MRSDREWLKEEGLSAYLMSFALTVEQYKEGSKSSTRRGGPEPAWCHLKPGQLIEGIEWGSRGGERWVCSAGCGWMCGRKWWPSWGRWNVCPECNQVAEKRPPRRLGLSLVLDVREERLADITPEEVDREGFPGLSPTRFVRGYCGDDVLGTTTIPSSNTEGSADCRLVGPGGEATWIWKQGRAPASRGWTWSVTRIKFARIIGGEVAMSTVAKCRGEHCPYCVRGSHTCTDSVPIHQAIETCLECDGFGGGYEL